MTNRSSLSGLLTSICHWSFAIGHLSFDRKILAWLRRIFALVVHICVHLWLHSWLAGRGVIASTETNSEPFLFHFYLDPAVTAVPRLIGRKIADVILAAQFLADLLERVFQFFHLERNKDSTACFLRKLLQDLVPLFARAHAKEAAAVDTDGVDYSLGSESHFQGLLQRRLARHVLAIGKNDDRLSPHFTDQLFVGDVIDRVIQGSPPAARRVFICLASLLESFVKSCTSVTPESNSTRHARSFSCSTL